MIFKLFKLSMERFSVGRPPTRVGQKVTMSDGIPLAPTETYPIEGTSYECGGEVRAMNRRKGTVTVEWNNNHSINTQLVYLKVLSNVDYNHLLKRGFVSDNPNFTFKSLQRLNKKKSKSKWGKAEQVYDSYTDNIFISVDTSNHGNDPWGFGGDD